MHDRTTHQTLHAHRADPPARRVRRALGATGLALTLALTAAACGDDPDGDSRAGVSATAHDDADVAFATEMVQHHAQALSMVDLTVGRTLEPEVQTLAESIRDAQAPEIETMVDWLSDWGEEVPATVRDHSHAGHDPSDVAGSMEGMDEDSMDMPGMMSADDMEALQDAPDDRFQTMWLEMMIEHHAGAVEMAETERDEGTYRPAVDLARSIIDSQTAEIEQMEALLGS